MSKIFKCLRLSIALYAIWAGSMVSATNKRCELDIIRLARFQPHIESLRPYLMPDEAMSVKTRADKMLKEDARHAVFQMEALTRIYRKVSADPFDKMRDQIKELEDGLGKLDEAEEYYNFAVKLDAPEGALHYLEKNVREARKALGKILEPWIEPRPEDETTRLDRMESKIKDWKNKNEEGERREILEVVVDQLKKIEDLPYSMHDLQKGIHEMRRQLRWILINIQALNGMILLDDGSAGLSRELLDHYGPLLDDPIASSEQNKVSENPAVKNPIRIHRILFLAVSKAVNDIKVIKEFGEDVESLEKALMESDPDRYPSYDEALEALERMLGKKHQIYYNWVDAAEKIRKEILETGLIKAIRKEIEKQI